MTAAAIVGAIMIIVTVALESFVIAVAVSVITRLERTLAQMPVLLRTVVLLCPLSLWLLFVGVGSAIWLWAALLVYLAEFDGFASAMYFTSVTATTLGYGDALLSERWRLLSGFIAANGLLLFSLNTAFLFEALRRTDRTEK